MNEALGTALIFVLIFIVVPWGLIFARRRPIDRCAAG